MLADVETVLIDCRGCDGTGAAADDVERDCDTCQGRCVERVPGDEVVRAPCSTCWGVLGGCARCEGTGELDVPAREAVSLRAGERGPEERARAFARRSYLVTVPEQAVRQRAASAGFVVDGWDIGRVIAVLARHETANEMQAEVRP